MQTSFFSLTKACLPAVVAIVMCSCSADPVPNVDVCALLVAPAEYDGKIVKVTGLAAMDRHLEDYMYDPSCSDYAIGIEASSNEVDLSTFRDSISSTPIPNAPDIKVPLTGRFKFYPAAHPGHMLFVTKVNAIPPNNRIKGGG